jgi:peptide chain release factor
VQAAKKAERDAKKAATEKERRRNRPRPRGVKEKLLQGKHKRSETKSTRGRVRDQD